MNARKTTQQYWDRIWTADTPRRLSSWFDVGAYNVQRLLKRHVSQGMSYLEIGCAPGRFLAWVAAECGARVAGLDYSRVGIDATEEIFRSSALRADLRCEDLFCSTFAPSSFDVVTSFGLIEHFDDPAPVVRQHLMLTKPGGLSIVVIPNYAGMYGKLQAFFNPANMGIHNLTIMQRSALEKLVPTDFVYESRVYRAGRIAPGLVTFENRLPARLAKLVSRFINVMGTLQPFDIGPVCPLLVLEMKKRRA